MEKRFTVILMVSLLAAGCTVSGVKKIEFYKAELDRVDQSLEGGNRGYIVGKAPAIDTAKRNLKRTLLGMDVELIGRGDESEEAVINEEKIDSSIIEEVPEEKTSEIVEEKQTSFGKVLVLKEISRPKEDIKNLKYNKDGTIITEKPGVKINEEEEWIK